jgi:hypothetical protein
MTSKAPASRPRRLVTWFVLVPILAVISLACWAFASPVGSSPDDDFHLASIWCAQGDRAPYCESTGDSASREVPKDLIFGSVCYDNQAATSASCQGKDYGTHPDVTVQTERGNFEGLYPRVFYLAMSIFVGPNIQISVLAMRIAASVFFVAFSSALFLLLPRRLKPTLVVSLVISVVPLGLFVIASINPSGWAVLSAGTLLLSLLGYYETQGRRRIGLGVVAALAALVGAGARADAAAYAGIAVVVAVVLGFRRSKEFALASILPAALVVMAVLFYFSAGQSAATSTGVVPHSDAPISIFGLVGAIGLQLPYLWAGVFGIWPLGWFDTPMPASVWAVAAFVFAGVVVAGLGLRYPRKWMATSIMLGALVLIPTFLLVQTRATVGNAIQPRYILPLIVMLAVVALLRSGPLLARPTWLQLVVVGAGLVMAQSLALHEVIRRYTTGTDVIGWNLDAHAEWWWAAAPSPLAVWMIGSVAFTAMIALIALKLRVDGTGSVIADTAGYNTGDDTTVTDTVVDDDVADGTVDNVADDATVAVPVRRP